MHCLKCGIKIDNVVNIAVLKAAVRWIIIINGKPIDDDKGYNEMMLDKDISEEYKRDITIIREALK